MNGANPQDPQSKLDELSAEIRKLKTEKGNKSRNMIAKDLRAANVKHYADHLLRGDPDYPKIDIFRHEAARLEAEARLLLAQMRFIETQIQAKQAEWQPLFDADYQRRKTAVRLKNKKKSQKSPAGRLRPRQRTWEYR